VASPVANSLRSGRELSGLEADDVAGERDRCLRIGDVDDQVIELGAMAPP